VNGWPPLANFLVALLLPPAWSYLWSGLWQRLYRRRYFLQGWLSGAGGGGTAALLEHFWAYALGAAVSTAVGLAIWWWRRRKRRNVLALMGQKSRLLRDALVRRVREVTKPSPVLRPQRSPA